MPDIRDENKAAIDAMAGDKVEVNIAALIGVVIAASMYLKEFPAGSRSSLAKAINVALGPIEARYPGISKILDLGER